MEWSYDTSLPGLEGYRIYHNEAFFGEINGPSFLAADIDVWLTEGINSFTMTAFDVDGNESAQSDPYLIEVGGPGNHLPVAKNDSASVVENESVFIDVVMNDWDEDGDPLTAVAVGQPNSGTAIIEIMAYDIRRIKTPMPMTSLLTRWLMEWAALQRRR